MKELEYPPDGSDTLMDVLKKDTYHKKHLVRKAGRTIHENSMLAYGSRILVGVSGGPDSVALLHVLIELAETFGYEVGVAHLNHGMRGESANRDADFVESLAKKRNVPYCGERIDLFEICKHTGKGLEEAGRDARYEFFGKTADRFGYDRIAVGHHLEDDAELILMNIIRGSGPTGMAGIAPVRGRIVRPLIDCSRGEIMSFLRSEKIEYVHDRTNDDTRFHRNHVRHYLIPALERYNPRVVENLHRLGRISALENEWAEGLVAPVFDGAAAARENGRLVIDISRITACHPAVKRRVVRKAVFEVKGDLKRIGFGHIDAVMDLIHKADPSGQLDLPDRIQVMRIGDHLVFTAETSPLRRSGIDGRSSRLEYEYEVTEEQAASGLIRIEETGAQILFNRLPMEHIHDFPAGDAAAFDWDTLQFPLSMRSMRPGDRFTPLGMSGTQKLKDFFINNKVPADKRGRIPVLTSGGQVVWITGMRMDDRFKITANTTTVLSAKKVEAH
jgi:tRNA(Ile)-lysidine synthase